MRCFVSGGKHRPNYFLKTSYTVPHANVKAAKKKKEKDSASQREQYAGRKGGGGLIKRAERQLLMPSEHFKNYLLLSGTLREWRSVPLWTATITSMATRACAPD